VSRRGGRAKELRVVAPRVAAALLEHHRAKLLAVLDAGVLVRGHEEDLAAANQQAHAGEPARPRFVKERGAEGCGKGSPKGSRKAPPTSNVVETAVVETAR